MGALDFDPFAVLAKLENRHAAPSTPPILPTLGGENLKTVGTVGTVGTVEGGQARKSKIAHPAECLITDLWEAAAIRAGDAPELSRADLDGAAHGMGLGDFEGAIAEALCRWARHLRGCDHPAVQAARENWHECEIAARMGWGTQSLFAERHGLIPRLAGRRIRVLGRDLAKSDCGVIWPRREIDGDWLIWAIPEVE